MNQNLPERRARKRQKISNQCELIVGAAHIPAEIVDFSFEGFRCRVASDLLIGQADKVEAVKLEGLPEVKLTTCWSGDEMFAATFVVSEQAGRIVAGFHELFVPPDDN